MNRVPFPRHRQARLPRVLRDDQLRALFAALKSPKYRALFMTCYAAGLRIGEACRLQVADIESRRMVIRVTQGKGAKERYTVLSPHLLEALRVYWKLLRPSVWMFPRQGAAGPVSPDSVRAVFRTARHLAQPQIFQQLLDRLYRTSWVVYAKPPFGGVAQVYRYLGRYTHRVAISNSRLISLQGDRVRFQYKDYADAQKSKELTLSAEEFLRRFLLHVLPQGFVRIRHYGLLASPNVQTKLKRCQWLLGPANGVRPEAAALGIVPFREWVEQTVRTCPHCGGPLTTTAFHREITPLTGETACPDCRPVPTIMDSS